MQRKNICFRELKAKVEFLRDSDPEAYNVLPKKPNAILVFGSKFEQVPNKVVELINNHPVLKGVPIIISGCGKEAADNVNVDSEAMIFNKIIQSKGIDSPIFLDLKAMDTKENIENMLEILKKEQIPANNIVAVNFSVLSKKSNRLLRKHIKNFLSVSAEIRDNKELQEISGLIDWHYNKESKLESK